MITTVISCVQRADNRRATLAQLEAFGLAPVVVESPCAPAGPHGNAAAALRAGEVALATPGAWLFCEDDIDLAPDFSWHLQEALELDAVTYLYLNDSPTRLRLHHGRPLANAILQQRAIERGAYRVLQRAALFGTQCVLIPERLKAKMVELLRAEHRSERGDPFDGRLHTWLRSVPDEDVFVMLPHPVQHRQDRTGREWTERVMRSLSFGIPYVLEDGTRSHQPKPRKFSVR